MFGKRTIYGILIIILVLWWLQSCDTNSNFRSTSDNHVSTVTPVNNVKSMLSVQDTPRLSPLSVKEEATSLESSDAGHLQGVGGQTGYLTENASTKQKKGQPASARLEGAETVAGIKTQSLELSQNYPQAKPKETTSGIFTEPVTGMKFILVRGGCYRMGSDHEKVFEGPMHEVCIDDFYLSKYEVTQKQWLTLMGRTVSHFYFQGKSRPTEWVNWDDIQAFIRELNRTSEHSYRLPTEAEWEYAARSGGKDETYAGTSDDISLEDFAWYRANSNGQTRYVGIKKPNGLGLHDMSGNVREWCSDWYGDDYYENSPIENPQGPDSGDYRVIRGGGWGLSKGLARTTYRDAVKPNFRGHDIGFRLAMTLK